MAEPKQAAAKKMALSTLSESLKQFEGPERPVEVKQTQALYCNLMIKRLVVFPELHQVTVVLENFHVSPFDDDRGRSGLSTTIPFVIITLSGKHFSPQHCMNQSIRTLSLPYCPFSTHQLWASHLRTSAGEMTQCCTGSQVCM